MSAPKPLRLEVASPCAMAWDAMDGDARRRFCGACLKNVYDLSRMSRAEIDALIVATEGRFCGRLFTRRDGTVLTADCPVGLRARLAHGARYVSAAWGAAGAFVVALLALSLGREPRPSVRGELEPVARLAPLHTDAPPEVKIPPLPSQPRGPVARARTTFQTLLTGERLDTLGQMRRPHVIGMLIRATTPERLTK